MDIDITVILVIIMMKYDIDGGSRLTGHKPAKVNTEIIQTIFVQIRYVKKLCWNSQ